MLAATDKFLNGQMVVNLGHLQDHLASCKYNPISDIIYYNGCNTIIRRCEYEGHNCITYFANRMSHQEDEITKLTCKLIEQRENLQ